ncbi:MAG TPA: hypothetical protein ENO23_08925, partial [Alphaproteobacteria bacterium]|nr:hypothetical protein [Alphaproteobacteria bacterium]
MRDDIVTRRRVIAPGRRPHGAALLACLLVPLQAAPVAAQGAPRAVREAAAQVLTLRGYDAAGRVTAQGSGFFFGPGRIATNLHVVQGAELVRVIGPA